jgi:hypothetical protein
MSGCAASFMASSIPLQSDAVPRFFERLRHRHETPVVL